MTDASVMSSPPPFPAAQSPTGVGAIPPRLARSADAERERVGAIPPRLARSADAERERISIAEASSARRARKALIFSRT